MKLLHRLGLTVAGVFAAYAWIDSAIQRRLVYPSFEDLEAEGARDDVQRVVESIHAELGHLDALCHDWAAWDDTVRFIAEHDQAYIESTLEPTTLQNAQLAVVAFFARDGRVVERRSSPEFSGDGCAFPECPPDLRDPSHPLHTIASSAQRAQGLISTPCGILLATARPILPSNEQGEPVGALLMARSLDTARLQQLQVQTRVHFQILPLAGGPPLDPVRAHALEELEKTGGLATAARDQDTRLAWALLRDYRDEPLAMIEASMPRSISTEGRRVVDYAQLSLLAAALLVLAVTFALLRQIVVAPLARVSAHAARLGAGGDLEVRLSSSRTDEIGDLSRAIDTMVDQISDSRTRLMRVAHLAGRSEVATEVLHNVGSVLTSTNVAAQRIDTLARSSRGADLGRLAQLLRAHEHDLAAFLTADARGRQVPEFVELLGQALGAEREALLAECEVLRQSLDHVRTLVQAQQKNAGHATFLEPVELSALFDLALRLAPGTSMAGIRIERRYAELARVPLAKHRVLEILVNLIKNAGESVAAAKPRDPRIELVLERAGDDRVRLLVRDNGLGIAPEDLTRMFAHGFTTKPDGHGFGLHSCANAARELGGSLRAESEGPGRGAAFVLELPLDPTGGTGGGVIDARGEALAA